MLEMKMRKIKQTDQCWYWDYHTQRSWTINKN